METTRVLILSFNASDLASSLERVLHDAEMPELVARNESIPPHRLADCEPALASFASRGLPTMVVLCLSSQGLRDAKKIFDAARRVFQNVPILVGMEATELSQWRELFELGVENFITPPFKLFDVAPRIWRLCARAGAGDPVVLRLKEKLGLKQLVGESAALLREVRKIPFLARCDASVLITGETGTGKEMFARAIHHLSSRSSKPFSPVNCGAIPVELVENELFGHEPGAFTGANFSAAGLLRETEGGSLFLDEVDSLPLLAQVKLLRFLQDKEFRPLGASKSRRADVRVIAASNMNLEAAAATGRFRQDLYYRLNVVGLVLPPLRERAEDIPSLARHFLAKHATAFGVPVKDFTRAAMQKLTLYHWPGNVRELENIIERAVILSAQEVLHPEDIELPIPATMNMNERESFQSMKAKTIAQFERAYVQEQLRMHDGNISHAARAAGKHRRAFWEIMRKHRIHIQPGSHLAVPSDPSHSA